MEAVKCLPFHHQDAGLVVEDSSTQSQTNHTSSIPFTNHTSSIPFTNHTSSIHLTNHTSSIPFTNHTSSIPFTNFTCSPPSPLSSYLSVGVIAAWDADDASEGTNARLTYSIEKNVIHERTGEAIFTVDPQTGLVRTALCCLDRETTPEYQIQVVASDGGGLKGTGTVVVRLADVNDNSPRLARQMWELEVDETWGDGAPANDTLLEISVTDKDISNYFFYRVVESSGWGWDHFKMRSVGTVGQLYATRSLDYENETHRRGFKFMVQVTDR
ncbi:hypothetical protein Pmani_036157, partial [Petrolisthes manimaculis]